MSLRPSLVRVMHILGADDEPRPFLECAVGRERHPVGFEVIGDRRRCQSHVMPRFLRLPWMDASTTALSPFAHNDKAGNDCYHAAIINCQTRRWPNHSKLKARLPRGLADRGPAEIAATRHMVEAIRVVFERYGFDPVETPTIEYTDALGKFLPDQDRPNEGCSRSRTMTSSGSRCATT